MIGHGYYWRKPKDRGRGWVMRVKRWKCAVCGKTVGSLPSFLLSFRHYLLEVIQAVVVARFEQGRSWAEVNRGIAQEGVPSEPTQQRWCQALAQRAPVWLGAVQATLAAQDSASPWLDVVGEASRVKGAVQALLQASVHLLAWAKTLWAELAGYGWNDRLRFLGLWGDRRGLGRLV
jgi:hypothetical protein